MEKLNMKNKSIYHTLVTLALLSVSCRSVDESGSLTGEGVVASVVSPIPGNGILTKALDADFGFSFSSGDRITVFNENGNEYMSYALVPWKSISDRASFNVEAFCLKDGLYFAAYPPLSSLSDPEKITLPLTGQIQKENNSTEHLSVYDYCLANAQIKDNSGYFKFEHKVCWLKIVLPAGRSNNDFKTLTFSAAEGVANAVTLNAKTGSVSGIVKPGDALSLELGTGNGLILEESDTLVAYMCLPAGSYSDIVLTAESSSSYRSVFNYSGNITLENGKYYLADIRKSDRIPLQEITDFGIYNCDSEGKTMSWIHPVAEYRRGTHQISWYSGAGITSFDFFELGTTDFTSFRIHSDNLVTGQDYQMDIVSGDGPICNGANFRLISRTDDTAWLFNPEAKLGCVIKINE